MNMMAIALSCLLSFLTKILADLLIMITKHDTLDEASAAPLVNSSAPAIAALDHEDPPTVTASSIAAASTAASPAAAPSKKIGKPSTRTSVIVLGAGMSGLACARELEHRGYSVLVVEARQRVGGRLNGGSIRTKRPRHGIDAEVSSSHIHIDLGGALIHGTSENPVASLVEEIGVSVQPVNDCLLLSNSGWPVDPREDERVSALFNDCLDIAFERIATPTEGDDTLTVSFGELFQAVCKEKNVSSSTLLQWHQANLEVSCGASFGRLGFKWNDDEQYGFDGDHVAIQQSWKAVMDAMAEGLDIVYSSPVKHIRIIHPQAVETTQGKASRKAPLAHTVRATPVLAHRAVKNVQPERQPLRISRRVRGVAAEARRSFRSRAATDHFTIDPAQEPPQRAQSPSKKDKASAMRSQALTETMVHVTLQNDTILKAHAVVCTLPLGVLKASSVSFDPPLPVQKQRAIQRLGIGLLNKCILSFSRVFWQDSDFLGLAADDRAYLVLNGHKYTGKPCLIFMYGGDFARDVQDWTDREIVDDCLKRLKTMCGTNIAPVLDYRITRWGKEQYSLMSFSYVPPGVDGPLEYHAMSEPILDQDDTVPVLMFAGEHTTPYHPSTIHGAYLSGIREAYRLDCALFPEANDNLEFQVDELYQRTFPMERRGIGVDGDLFEGIANDSTPAASGNVAGNRLRRRRGAATVIKVSDRDSVAFVKESKSSSARRRQRESKFTRNESFSEADDRLQDDIVILEDDQIARGIESYGKDYEFLQANILPVHGTSTRWTFSQVKRRVQSLFSVLKKSKPGKSSTWRRWVVGDDKRTNFSATLTPISKPAKSRVAPKSAAVAAASLGEAVPPLKKAQLLTVTRSGRKVRTLFTTPKRPNGIKTRSGRSIKKPRTL